MAGLLKGKVAIVTGGSKGIGKAIAFTFAKAGANVVICSRKKDNLEAAVAEAESKGFDIDAVECNTSDSKSIKNVVDFTIHKFSTVDILVNNAAANPYYGPILNSEDSHWDKIYESVFDINFNFMLHIAFCFDYLLKSFLFL